MVVKFQTSMKSNGNKGSSSAMANYLEKEDLENEKNTLEKGEIPDERKGFFNHEREGVKKEEVIENIDNNKKGLKKNESKFYSATFSPSEKEQQHILKNVTGREISNIDQLSKEELKQYENQLQDYTRNSMNEYASHFKRDGLRNGNQIKYYGKIEHQRHYKGTDPEVKHGLAKVGDKKPGLNSHSHVIISRKDIDQKRSLSPLAKDRDNPNARLNGRNVQKGFDRNLYNVKSEKVFDKQFNYQRETNEKVEHRIQSSKDIQKSTKADLTNDIHKKESINKEIVSDFDNRHGYTEKDKQLSHEIEPSFKEEKQPEQQQNRSNDHEQEIEY